MENKLDSVINEILQEVEEKNAEVTSSEENSSTPEKAFKTQIGEKLYKVAQLCREITDEENSLTYSDMQVFLERLYAKNTD